MSEHGPGGDPDSTGAPATEAEIAHLARRLRFEVGLTNALGGLVLAIGAVIFEPPARTEGDAGAAAAALWALVLVIPAWVAGVWASNRLVRPLFAWLREGRAGEPAPDPVQRLLLAHPGLQAAVLLALWLTTALGLAVADVLIQADEPVREFVITLVGVSIAGVVVSALSFLAVLRVLGPWYGRFLAGDDPTRHNVPSTRVRRRLVMVFLLGTAIPLVLIGGVVSERLSVRGSPGQLEAIVWFLVGVGLLSALYLTLSVRHSITRPLELIRRAADQVRHGDLSVAVPVESADEFGELSLAFNAMVEGLRERRRLEDLLGRQVGDAVAARALHEGVTFDVERRVASVLFLDLAGFTAMTEHMEPEDLVATLNRVFDIVIREVDARHGLVNKFMGDAVLAVFNAPIDDPDHARHAVEAARAITSALERERVAFGIGVSTGPVVAGNVGAEARFEYTVVGDAVNEAARLQELTRERGTPALVSGATAVAVGPGDGLAPAGTAVLRGRSSPSEVYALR